MILRLLRFAYDGTLYPNVSILLCVRLNLHDEDQILQETTTFNADESRNDVDSSSTAIQCTRESYARFRGGHRGPPETAQTGSLNRRS